MIEFIDPDEKLNISNTMIKSGGGFVKALGNALILADQINSIKIKNTFSEYWQQYKIMFEEEQVK